MGIYRRFWRFRLQGLVLTWCIAIAGWGWIVLQPTRYEAVAQVYVNADSSLEILAATLEADQKAFTVSDMVRQSLIDRQQLDRVINAAGPLHASGADGGTERAVRRVLERIEISTSAKLGNLFRVSYSDMNRRTASSVVDAFIATIDDETIRTDAVDEYGNPEQKDGERAARFRLVDPPTVRSATWPPNRKVWIVLILLAAVGAGAGLAYLLTYRNPVFANAEQIFAVTGITVTGAITHAWMADAKAQQRRDYMLFSAGLVALTISFAVVLLI